MSTVAAERSNDRLFFVLASVVSVAALAFLTWLLLLRDATGTDPGTLSFMPAVNAGLNATAALLLVLGWRAIRAGQVTRHQWLMIGTFVCSALFLVGYVAYHYLHGDTRYEGPARGLYLAMLASHVLLSIPVVPMALAAFYFAWRERFATHRKVTRWLAPIWLYVSVTGVLVYVFLHVLAA
jgi:putative membrane protein